MYSRNFLYYLDYLYGTIGKVRYKYGTLDFESNSKEFTRTSLNLASKFTIKDSKYTKE